MHPLNRIATVKSRYRTCRSKYPLAAIRNRVSAGTRTARLHGGLSGTSICNGSIFGSVHVLGFDVKYVLRCSANSLTAEAVMFRRFLLIIPGAALIFWISSLFHGTTAFFVFLLLWFEFRRICKVLFVRSFFQSYGNFQTLGLSS
jgi:hypothetical protein